MRSAGRTRRTKPHGAVLIALASFGLALVAGCTAGGSSSSSPAPPTSPAATSAAPSTPAAVSTSASAVSTPSPSAPATSAPATSSSPVAVGGGGGGGGGGAPACATRGLQASLGVSQGAAGSIYQVIDFTNISGGPCTLFGYPGVALAAGTPVAQVGGAASRSSAAAATLVTLGAGETANALLRVTEAVNYPVSRCHPVATTFLQIYPPNQTTPIYLAYKSTGCSVATVPLLSIGVVQAGPGSSGT
jgi:hypothetical protein